MLIIVSLVYLSICGRFSQMLCRERMKMKNKLSHYALCEFFLLPLVIQIRKGFFMKFSVKFLIVCRRTFVAQQGLKVLLLFDFKCDNL